MQIKNEKSCRRSMSDEDLVRAVRPGLTAVGLFMFHFCNIFSLHVQFLIYMSYFQFAATFLICMCDPSGPPYITDALPLRSLRYRRNVDELRLCRSKHCITIPPIDKSGPARAFEYSDIQGLFHSGIRYFGVTRYGY